MRIAHSRNLFHLYGSKALILGFLVFFLLTGENTYAQYNNYQGFKNKPYYFGLSLGLNSSKFKPYRSKDFLRSDSSYLIESVSGPGFNVGIITNFKVSEYFDFRFIPSFAFTSRNINYNYKSQNATPNTKRIDGVLVEMPFQLRYKSALYRDRRLFAMAGVKYAYDVASDSRSRQAEKLVRISPNDFNLEYGAGVQIFFPFFIFSPEIKVSHGLGNTLIYNDSLEESRVLEKLLSRTFTITFNFEG